MGRVKEQLFDLEESVEMLRRIYPVGTKIQVDNMEDEQAVPSGSVGTVLYVDDAGQIHLKEFGLVLIEGVDTFHKI